MRYKATTTFLRQPITIISAVIAVATYLIAIIKHVEPALSLMLSIQPVVIGLLLELQVEVLKNRDANAESWEFNRKMRDSPELFLFVEKILGAWSDEKTRDVPFPALRRLIASKFDQFSTDVVDLGAGRAQFDAEQWFSIDTLMMSAAKREILAVSHAESHSIWDTPTGRLYWETNRERINKGVKCKRIFVISQSDLADPSRFQNVTRIMREQAAGGATVLVAEEIDLSPRLCRDMAIVDRSTRSFLLWTGTGTSVGIELAWNPQLVHAAVSSFDLLAEKSMSLEGYLAGRLAIEPGDVRVIQNRERRD